MILITDANTIVARSKKFADETGIKLNFDKVVVDGVVKGLLMNEETHGALYCSCRLVTGGKKEDAKAHMSLHLS